MGGSEFVRRGHGKTGRRWRATLAIAAMLAVTLVTAVDAPGAGAGSPLTCPEDDPGENDNDDPLAGPLTPSGVTVSGIVCGGDADLLGTGVVDWYRFATTAGDEVIIRARFDHDDGDLDLELRTPFLTLHDAAVSSTDDEQIRFTAPVGGVWFLGVEAKTPGVENSYDLRISSPACPHNDVYEDNDTQATATAIGPEIVVTAGPEGIICAGDEDWFQFPVQAGQEVGAALWFNHLVGRLDLYLYDPTGALVDSSTVNDSPQIMNGHYATQTGLYAVRVDGVGSAENTYQLDAGALFNCVTDDTYEENDSQASATPVINDTVVYGRACPDDDDWFEIPVDQGELITVDARFDHIAGDIDIVLHDPTGAIVDSSVSTTDDEVITQTAAMTGDYAVRVYGYSGASASYSLTVTAGPHPQVKPFGTVVVEGDTGSQIIQAVAYLDAQSPTPITVDWATVDVHPNPAVAQAGSDFVAASGTLVFPPGVTYATVPIEILGDTVVEPPLLYGEWGLSVFSNPSQNAKIWPGFYGLALFIIIDND